MNKPYIIYAPKYQKSTGARVLYKLAKLLEQKGFETYVYSVPSEEYKDCKYITHKEITEDIRKNGIIIYPEIVVGNPLQFQNVVRWILYFPGKNGGTETYSEKELIYTHSPIYYQTSKVLSVILFDTELFYKDDTPKTENCYFVYKNGKWKDIPEFENMTEININYPATREELANLLRRTKTLYSYDRYSAILREAAMCGCDVQIVTEDGFEKYEMPVFTEADFKHFEEMLVNFIADTQKMNYTGKPEACSIAYNTRIIISKLKYFFYTYIFPNKKIAEKHFYRCNRYLI